MREQGVIKKFVTERGFGFIARPGCLDVFFHISEFEPVAAKLIQPGARVEFEVETGPAGRLRAVDVKVVAADGSDAVR